MEPVNVNLSLTSLIKFLIVWESCGQGCVYCGMNLGPRPNSCCVPGGGVCCLHTL